MLPFFFFLKKKKKNRSPQCRQMPTDLVQELAVGLLGQRVSNDGRWLVFVHGQRNLADRQQVVLRGRKQGLKAKHKENN